METATKLPTRMFADPPWAPTAGTLPNWLVSAPCCDVGGSPILLALLRGWQRQPWRQANYAAFRDALAEADAPPEVLNTVDELWAWACRPGSKNVFIVVAGGRRPTRTARREFARRDWRPALEAAFGPEPEMPF